MFTELDEELLDLQATVRGYGSAVYASLEDEPGCSGGGCCALCIILCCQLCW